MARVVARRIYPTLAAFGVPRAFYCVISPYMHNRPLREREKRWCGMWLISAR